MTKAHHDAFCCSRRESCVRGVSDEEDEEEDIEDEDDAEEEDPAFP